MSVVCAKILGNRIELSADSIMVYGYSKDTRNIFSKVNEANGMIMGAVGLCRETSFMWHYMQTNKPADATDRAVLEFMISFAKWKKDLTNDSSVENDYMLIFGNKIFQIEGLFVYSMGNEGDFGSIGAGRDFANTALKLGKSPSEAVKIACELSCYVAEPILNKTIVITKDNIC